MNMNVLRDDELGLMVVLVENYPSVLLLVTLNLFQGHSVKQRIFHTVRCGICKDYMRNGISDLGMCSREITCFLP